MTLSLIPDYELAKHTWLGVGGKADFFAIVETLEDLKDFLKQNKLPVMILGGGSNILIRNGGIEGVVLKLGKGFQDIQVKDDLLICGAGAKLSKIAQTALQNNLTGFEFLSDIPGTLGGGLSSNAGAFGQSLSDVLVQINAVDYNGQEKQFTDFSDWSYRHNPLKDLIFTGAVLKAKSVGINDEIKAVMQDFHIRRKTTQPQGVRTAGSTFKNPKEKSAGFLLENSGLKGYKENGAEMSAKHANFLINHHATGNQLEDFVLKMQKIVFEKQGILLEMEIKCLGKR